MQDTLRRDMLPDLDSANALLAPAPFTCPREISRMQPGSFAMLPEESIIRAERSRIVKYFPPKATKLKLSREGSQVVCGNLVS